MAGFNSLHLEAPCLCSYQLPRRLTPLHPTIGSIFMTDAVGATFGKLRTGELRRTHLPQRSMHTGDTIGPIAYCTDIGLHGRRQRTYGASYARKGVDVVLRTSIGPITVRSAVGLKRPRQ